MMEIVSYLTARQLPLPPINAAMYEYVLASNGVFVRGERQGLKAIVPVAKGTVRGLADIEPSVEMTHPRIPAYMLTYIVTQACMAKDESGQPVESLFHLSWAETSWQLETPPQERGPARVYPAGSVLGSSYERALVEIHSHHAMQAQFSPTDNADETGFRIFAVLGEIFAQPSLRVRVGIYGHHWEIPAEWVFDMPDWIADEM